MTSAISVIADSSVQSKEATLTIEAEVVEIIDEGLGIYKVKYLGNEFEATTAHIEISYQIGDMVYVVIPNGNFDKNKIILSPVTSTSTVYTFTENGINYIPISSNLFKSVENVALSTYRTEEQKLVDYDLDGFSSLFNAALKDSRTFNFTCKIKTNIEKERRSKGDYGLELYLTHSSHFVNTFF